METALTAQITATRTLSNNKVEAPPQAAILTKLKQKIPEEKPCPPGPGSYNISRNLSPEAIQKAYNAISFAYHGTVRKSTKDNTNKLGPGAYSLPITKKAPAFSFGDRFDGIPLDHPSLLARRKLVEREVHEPGLMGPIDYIGRSPGIKMSPPPKERKKLDDPTIGPGSYTIKSDDYSPKYTMPGRRTKSITVDSVPGPGEYKPEAAVNYIFPPLAKTISVVVPEIKQGYSTDTPGPGAYNPKQSDTIHAYKYFIFQQPLLPRISKPVGKKLISPEQQEKPIMVREEDESSTSPTSPKSHIKTTFGTAPREGLVAKSITPAPNAYQSPSLTKGKKKKGKRRYEEPGTFGAKNTNFIEPNFNPGPGTYFPEIKRNSSPTFTIGRSNRQSPERYVYTDKYYDTVSLYPAPKIGFGTSQKDVEIKKSRYPGPGSYEMRGSFGELPEYALKSSNAK
eukprot:TRINITY_DN88350_c0_g1_i1.p1 TRINITY_DN88350_c0_g1~~TRINITY_DN88350_c0_g1_i1.p1  ORF type:complete len:452 (+),score=37.02 TRINITY_DN88350_c0_g1_i1:441-1796(+)